MVPGPHRRSRRPPRSALPGRHRPARQVQDLVPVGSDPDAAEPHDPDALHRRRVGRARRSTMPCRRRCRRIRPPSHRSSTSSAPSSRPGRAGMIAEGGFEYLASQRADRHREGSPHRPRRARSRLAARFGHSSLVELPAPTDTRLTEADAGAEFVRDPLLLRAGYTGSFFHNDVTSVMFDNPFRAIDSASASSRGRLTLAPSNSYNGVNGLASREAAASLARERVRLGRPAHRRRRSDRAADDQFGAAAGAARARHGGRRGADDGGQPHLCLPADPLRRLHGRLSAIRLRQPDAGIRDDAARLLRQRASRPWLRRSIPNRSACFGTRWMPTSS